MRLSPLRPAVFMDRDGTLSHEVGYVNHPSRFRLFPFSVEAVRLVEKQGGKTGHWLRPGEPEGD